MSRFGMYKLGPLQQFAAGLAVITMAVAFGWLAPAIAKLITTRPVPKPVPEIQQILALDDHPADQADVYQKLIERVGPVQAQELLAHSGLPSTGETHLVNHRVGEYLYKKYGDGGLVYCKEYFLGSCYHGFLLNVIGSDPNKGMDELNKVMNLCDQQSAQISVQCAHAFGHGFLAAAGYARVPVALARCDQMHAERASFPSLNCYDGVFMENIWAVHGGGKSPDQWVKADDLSYPCNDPRIEQSYQQGCWMEQPSLAYRLSKGSAKAVSDLCMGLSDTMLRSTCFGGLARQLHPVAGDNVDRIFAECGKVDAGWSAYCLGTIASSSYSSGNSSLPFQICSRMSGDDQKGCYARLIYTVRAFAHKPYLRFQACNHISDKRYRDACKAH